MDQGIAGVIAGIAGLLGAGIGGLATAYGARLGAQKTIEAVQTQVDRQSAAEHRHWVREQRKQVYSSILEGHAALLAACEDRTNRLEDCYPLSDELITDDRDEIARFGATVAKAHLWGPDEIVSMADELFHAAVDRFVSQVEWSAAIQSGVQTAMQERWQAFRGMAQRETEARVAFVRAAHAALAAPA
jgi:hypothetical protein